MQPKDATGVRFPDVDFAPPHEGRTLTLNYDSTPPQTPPPLQPPIPHAQDDAPFSSHFGTPSGHDKPHFKLGERTPALVGTRGNLHYSGASLSAAVAFYENSARIVLLEVDEFETNGQDGPDIRYLCEFLTAQGTGLTPRLTFTVHTYSESGTFGIEHRVKFTPNPGHVIWQKLGEFQESDFLAHAARSFFIGLTRRIDLALEEPSAETSGVLNMR